MAYPNSCSRAEDCRGVMPPSTRLINRGASTSRAIRSISSTPCGASTKMMSAPAWAYRFALSMAASSPSGARASVRATTSMFSSLVASRATMSSRLSSRSRRRCRAGVVGMRLLSVQCAGDRRGEKVHEVPDVVEAIKLDHRAFDRGGAVAVGDPVGQSMELDDELVVVAGVVGCAVRLGDAGAVHGPVVGGDGQVGGEPFGDVGAVSRLVELDLGAVDEMPDVVCIESVRRELLGQHVSVQ